MTSFVIACIGLAIIGTGGLMRDPANKMLTSLIGLVIIMIGFAL